MPVKQIININLPGSKSCTNRALICAALADGRTRLFGFGECEDTLMVMEALRAMGVKIQNSKVHVMPTWHGKSQNENSKLKIEKFLEVRGGIDKLRLPKGQIYIDNAGTAMRFLVTLLGLISYKVKSKKLKVKSASQKVKVESKRREVILTGSQRMCERPIGDLLEALGELGIQAESVKRNGCPPLIIQNLKLKIKKCPPASQACPLRIAKQGGRAKALRAGNSKLKINEIGGRTKLRGNASSQYLSSILLCAPYFDRDTEIEIIGELTSKPYVDITVEAMRQFGVKVINQKYRYFKVMAGQKYKPCDYQIEPDASAASYFMAGAMLTGQVVRFPGLSVNSKQGDVGFVRVLNQMQKSKCKNQNVIQNSKFKILEFVGCKRLQGIDAGMNDMPDLVPTLAVLAMFADGRTVIKNVANLRIKETDRIKALATEIRKFGVKVREFDDGLEIVGKTELRNRETEKLKNRDTRQQGGQAEKQRSVIKVRTYNDHRMAMAFAVAKLVIPDIMIENQSCVEKSFPRFWDEWRQMDNLFK